MDHDCSDYRYLTIFRCDTCGEQLSYCKSCAKDLHESHAEASKDKRQYPKGFRQIPEFPDYIVDSKACVLHAKTRKYCLLVRVSSTNGAIINLRKDGKIYARAAQALRARAFPERFNVETM